MKIIIQIIIIFLVYIFIEYVNLKNKKNKLEAKTRENKIAEKTGIYILTYSTTWKIFSVFALSFFTVMLIISIGNYYNFWDIVEGVDIPAIIGLCLIDLLAFSVFLIICIWKIEVHQDVILYRNYIGKKREYKFNEIELRMEHNEIVAYKKGKKIFKIGVLVENRYLILHSYGNQRNN